MMSEAQSTKEELSFVDPQGVRIFYYRYLVAGAKAIVQLEHGLGEYATRYEKLIAALNADGYSVYADDHRGHGQTGMLQHGGDKKQMGKLGPGGLRATIADIRQLTGIISAEHPELPLYLFGHSWGSLMAQIIVNDHASDYAGVVLSGSAYRTPLDMYGGDLNHKHKHLGTTGFEWLSRDPEVAKAFAADPLCFPADVLKLFGVADGLRLYGKPKAGMAQLPILLQVGDDDPLGGGKSVSKLAESYRTRAAQEDVEVKIYPGARHEIFNETNADEVRQDL
ncbi:MAG: alpha/beta fold hydrolase, partial [Microbacteriaceae bacterium]